MNTQLLTLDRLLALVGPILSMCKEISLLERSLGDWGVSPPKIHFFIEVIAVAILPHLGDKDVVLL